MYTKNLVEVFVFLAFISKQFSIFKNFRISFYFFQMIKKTFNPKRSSMEEDFST
jgi:hypothetical protein